MLNSVCNHVLQWLFSSINATYMLHSYSSTLELITRIYYDVLQRRSYCSYVSIFSHSVWNCFSTRTSFISSHLMVPTDTKDLWTDSMYFSVRRWMCVCNVFPFDTICFWLFLYTSSNVSMRSISGVFYVFFLFSLFILSFTYPILFCMRIM